ncbi:response regulator transcription factor [Oleiagrimonas sp.]|jgi:two-component system invasion response regulator UvrY|uniref:response regulator n=1 Tax=Oleiagrimonas sp. TaxID=2010330 RepID=UPI002615C3B8|nr:response regulator transcription factor [Oleiagrimonas sp.]MDA3913454.1 response regulator transcription factor [Oleiagrimonas sp.]
MMRVQVLVADDHGVIRNGLRKILDDTSDLEFAGEAWDGASLVERLNEHDWGLLILDLSMPGRNGLEMIKRVKELQPRLPILVFTMHQEEQYAVRALQSGASGYLTKEFDGDLLLRAIRKVASGGVYISAKVAELLARNVVRPDLAPPHTTLSGREYEVFTRLVRGMSLTDIAEEFCLSIKTVSTHKTHLLEKMGLSNQSELMRYAMRHGLVDLIPEDS